MSINYINCAFGTHQVIGTPVSPPTYHLCQAASIKCHAKCEYHKFDLPVRFTVIQLFCFQHCWEQGQKMLVKLMVGQNKAWEFGGVLRIILWLLDHVPSLAASPEPQSVCLLGYASSLVPPCSPGIGWSTRVTWVCTEQQWSAPSRSPRVIAAPLDRLRPTLQRIKYTRSTLLKMRQKTENRQSNQISCPLLLSSFSMRSKDF